MRCKIAGISLQTALEELEENLELDLARCKNDLKIDYGLKYMS